MKNSTSRSSRVHNSEGLRHPRIIESTSKRKQVRILRPTILIPKLERNSNYLLNFYLDSFSHPDMNTTDGGTLYY
jgi:hypothetical protein